MSQFGDQNTENNLWKARFLFPLLCSVAFENERVNQSNELEHGLPLTLRTQKVGTTARCLEISILHASYALVRSGLSPRSMGGFGVRQSRAFFQTCSRQVGRELKKEGGSCEPIIR